MQQVNPECEMNYEVLRAMYGADKTALVKLNGQEVHEIESCKTGENGYILSACADPYTKTEPVIEGDEIKYHRFEGKVELFVLS